MNGTQANKRESVTHVRVMDSLYFSCRIIIVDHRLNTCCAFLPFDLESVKVCLSRSKFVKNPEKYVKMYYAYISSNGKGMYNMKDVQNAISTHKYISELLGKETIDTRTSSQSKGRNGSFSQNFQQTGRELMTPDEVRRLDNKNAIVLIRGEKPVIDEKYDILKHPNIHRTEDGGAPPYLHTPLRAFAADDLSFPIDNIDDIEFLEA